MKFYHTTLYQKGDEIEAIMDNTEEENSVSKAEGYNNIAGWLCFTSPKLSKLGKRKSQPDEVLEPEFITSSWIDRQSQGNLNAFQNASYLLSQKFIILFPITMGKNFEQ